MKAVIVEKPGKVVIRKTHSPRPSPYETLVSMEAGCICNSTDRKLIGGHFPSLKDYPIILGHEEVGANKTSFPKHAVLWEFNYRGELLFLHQARARLDHCNLIVEDGWTYFLHGWSQVVAEVFHSKLNNTLFDEMRNTAERLRTIGQAERKAEDNEDDSTQTC